MRLTLPTREQWDFPDGSMIKNLPASTGDSGDAGSVPQLGRSSRGGNGNPLQYSFWENPMDRRAWLVAEVHSVAESQTRLRD